MRPVRKLSFLLLVLGCSAVLVTSTGAGAVELERLPVADGSVTDVNADGAGDWILDGMNSVVVGWNALDPGEHRGVYEFDVRDVPACAPLRSASLGLNLAGSRFDGTDPNLALFAAPGNGVLDVDDYAASEFVTAFFALPDVSVPVDEFETVLNVAEALEALRAQGADFATFVIRPNPVTSSDRGAFLYTSVEIGSVSDQFFPAELRLAVDPCPVEIDVKSGDPLNRVSAASEGVVPLALMTAPGVGLVDPATVRFGVNGTEAAAQWWIMRDVDRDGDDDLVLFFSGAESGVDCDAREVALTGMTESGVELRGRDSVLPVGCP